MKNIKKFNEFLNESSEYKIDIYNVLEFKDKLIAIIATLEDDKKENLRKGLDFVLNNLSDYSKDDFVEEICNNFFNDINILISRRFPKFWKSEDKGYSGHKFTGKNYEKTKSLSKTEIAKLIKKELNIEFPDWKFSMSSKNNSIRIEVIDMPYNPYSEIVDNAFKTNTSYNLNYNQETYNEQYLKDSSKIKSILEQYNYDDSNAQIDYSNNRYYTSLSLDDTVKAKYYPENLDVLRSQEWRKDWAEKTAKAKAHADQIKSMFKYKKGEEVIYIYDRENSVIPIGEYPAVILKAPNGRGMYPHYEIRFTIDKKMLNGELVILKTPQTYTTTLIGDGKLKEKI